MRSAISRDRNALSGSAAVSEAERELAECLRMEAEASRAVAAIEDEIAGRTEAASSIEVGDQEVEAFGMWLRGVRKTLHAAIGARERAEAETVRARAVLLLARAAAATSTAVLSKSVPETTT
jgi:hypothetical protein